MADKVFKSYREQLKILRGRGVDIPVGTATSTRAVNILKKENYYDVVNGYKDVFLATSSPDTYLPGTKLDDLYAVFEFDRAVRLIYLKNILKIEHQVKSVIAYEFSKKYGYDNYLKLENFDSSIDQREVYKTICTLQSALADQIGKNDSITHYISTYGYVPMWVLVNILTLGNISKFFELMKPTDKNDVARVFNIQPQNLLRYLKNLTIARNKCAHDERFYDLTLRAAISSSGIRNFNLLSIPLASGSPIYGIKDLFSIAIIFSQFLSKTDIKKFVKEMEKEFDVLKSKISTSQSDQIINRMGFYTNWKKLILLVN